MLSYIEELAISMRVAPNLLAAGKGFVRFTMVQIQDKNHHVITIILVLKRNSMFALQFRDRF